VNEAKPASARTDLGLSPQAFDEAKRKVGGHGGWSKYSEATKAIALAALRANGGNIKRTARQLASSMGIPRTTLADWAHDEEKAAPEELRNAANEALASINEMAALKFATLLSNDEVIAQIAAMSPRDLAVAMKITIESMQLLRGKPTNINAGDPWAAILRDAAQATKEAPKPEPTT
jgi:transposase-like protein